MIFEKIVRPLQSLEYLRQIVRLPAAAHVAEVLGDFCIDQREQLHAPLSARLEDVLGRNGVTRAQVDEGTRVRNLEGRLPQLAMDPDGNDVAIQTVEVECLFIAGVELGLQDIVDGLAGRVGEASVHSREVGRSRVELRVADIDGVSPVLQLAGFDDGLLADEGIRPIGEQPELGGARLVAGLQATVLPVGVRVARPAIGEPALLVALEVQLGGIARRAEQRRIGRSHVMLGGGDLGIVLGKGRRSGQRCKQRRRRKKPHDRLHALRRRTASSISAVEPAKEMRKVPEPRARSKSMPGVVATPASPSMRRQNSRLSLVRCATSQ